MGMVFKNMGELKSEIAFPKEKRKVLGNGSENYQLVLDYSNALILAELEIEEAKNFVEKVVSMKGFDEDRLKKFITDDLQELVAEPEGTYEDGHNNGIEMCIRIIKKLNFVKILIKGK